MARVQALLACIGDWRLEAHVGDPIIRPILCDADGPRQFALCMAVTQFGLRLRNLDLEPMSLFSEALHFGEARQVLHLLEHTQGVALAVVPDKLLARVRGGERSLKEQLVRDGVLQAVVALPVMVSGPRFTPPW